MDDFILGYALGLVLFVLCMPAKADEYTINIHLASKHINASGLNEVNPGIGLEYNNYIVGIYKNSLRKPSVYAVRAFSFNPYTGIKYGVVTGYGRLSPMLAGYLRMGHVEIIAIPPCTDIPTTLGVSLRF